MANKITEFLSQNPHWVDIVKAARCRGFLHCFKNGYMNFVPALPYEPGDDVDEFDLHEILAKEFGIQLREELDADWLNDCAQDMADSLRELKAGKNALIFLEEPTEDGDGFYYQHEVVPLHTPVAA